MKKNIFTKYDFISHSGLDLDFKIECDNLTDGDLETIAYIISKRFDFYEVFGIPRGGIRIEKVLNKYKNPKSKNLLIVDDVLTTGNSFVEAFKDIMGNFSVREENLKPGTKIIGVVIFARNKCPGWVYPLFQLWEE